MKKMMLIAFLLVIRQGMAQFSCVLDGVQTDFTLVQNKIFVQYKESVANPDLSDWFGSNDMIDFLNSESPKNSMQVVKLKQNYTQAQIKTLLELLNKSPYIRLASPLVNTGNIVSGLSTQIVVKLKSTTTEQMLNDLCAANEVANHGLLMDNPGLYILNLPKKKVINQMTVIGNLLNTHLFDMAEPILIRFLDLYTNDPLYSSQYGLNLAKVPDAWTKMGALAGANNTSVIAVLDDGVDLVHPDLFGKFVYGFDATYYNPLLDDTIPPSAQTVSNGFGAPFDPNDTHGTQTTGVFGAIGNNAVGIAGVAYNCNIMPVRMGKTLGGKLITDDLIIAKAFEHARIYGATVVSCSWGGGVPSTIINDEIWKTITFGRQNKGCPVFFASGNDNSTTISYPASNSNVIAVGATNASDQRASFSNYSGGLDIAAPGEGILTTNRVGAVGSPGFYSTVSGTSFSAPLAAGVMALVLTVNPSLSLSEARQIIESTCDKVGNYNYTTTSAHPSGTWCSELGYGRINAESAVAKAMLNNTASGPNTITISKPVVSCYKSGTPGTSVYFDLTISGGNPYTNQWNPSSATGYTYFMLDYVTDTTVAFDSQVRLSTYNVANAIGHPNSIYFPKNTYSAPSGVKRIFLNFPAGSTFPFQTDFYIRIAGAGGALRHIPVHIDAYYAPDFTMAPQINRCNPGNVYTANVVSGIMTTPGSTYSWALGNYPNTAAGIDYTTDPNYPSISGTTHDETITLTITSPQGCSTSKSTYVKVSNIQVVPAPSLSKRCSSVPAFMIGPSQVSGGIGSYTYQWTAAPGLTNTGSKYAMVNPGIAGLGVHNYTLTITDANGCSKIFTYSVDIQAPVSSVNLTANYNNGCPGHDVTITGNINGPYGIYNDINYFFGPDTLPKVLITPTLSKTTVSPYVSTTYQFKAKDEYGCLVTGTIPITVQTNYSLAANAGPDMYACSYNLRSVTGSASGGTLPYDYLWQEPLVYNQTLTLPNSTQTYTLVVKDSNGCRAKDQVNITASPGWTTNTLREGWVAAGNASGPISPSPVGGGTAPFTYLWTPSQFFVDPTVYNAVTIPLNESFSGNLEITDANGCVFNSNCNYSFYVTGVASPGQLFPQNDACEGNVLEIGTVRDGLTLLGGSYIATDPYYAPGLIRIINLQCPSSAVSVTPSANNSYVFNPAPISQSNGKYYFASGVNNVTVTVNQAMGNLFSNSFTTTYTFPAKDNSRNNLVALGTDAMIYVGTDQLLHKMVLESIGNTWRWNHYLITPQGGWGTTRVEGWLALNTALTKVYFKGTDQKMYQMTLPLSVSPVVQQLNLPGGLNVKSDLVYRQDGVYFIGSDNYIHRINPSTNAYEAVSPSNGWGGLTVVGHLAAAPYPQTHLAFLTSDNLVRDLYESSGAWWLGTISSTASTGETMIDPQNGDVYYKTTANKIETLTWNNTTKVYGSQTLISATNDPNYAVDGYLVKDQGMNRIFYKDMDGRMANIYLSSGMWYSYPFDYNMTDVAGDIRLVSQDRFFYINKDKSVHEVTYTQTGWYDRNPAPALPKNVKACSYNYKSLLREDEEFSDPSESVFKVYPNPANTKLAIEYITEVSGSYTISLMDVTSRIVEEITLDKNQQYLEMDLKDHVDGVYFVNLFRDGTLIENKKIIVRH